MPRKGTLPKPSLASIQEINTKLGTEELIKRLEGVVIPSPTLQLTVVIIIRRIITKLFINTITLLQPTYNILPTGCVTTSRL